MALASTLRDAAHVTVADQLLMPILDSTCLARHRCLVPSARPKGQAKLKLDRDINGQQTQQINANQKK